MHSIPSRRSSGEKITSAWIRRGRKLQAWAWPTILVALILLVCILLASMRENGHNHKQTAIEVRFDPSPCGDGATDNCVSQDSGAASTSVQVAQESGVKIPQAGISTSKLHDTFRVEHALTSETIVESSENVPEFINATEAAYKQPRPPCNILNATHMLGAPPCKDDDTGPDVRGNAKVALMFLVRNTIPTEPIWSAFMAAASQLTLRKHVAPTQPGPPVVFPDRIFKKEEFNTTCWNHGGKFTHFTGPFPEFRGDIPEPIEDTTKWLSEVTGTSKTPRELYEEQDFFTIYVHRADITDVNVSPESIFYGRDIPTRLKTGWGWTSFVAAHKLMLEQALKDRRNSQFLLLTEACIPLYHPALFWTQLIAEGHLSRVGKRIQDMDRWTDLMATEYLSSKDFTKSSSYTAVSRMHAQLIVRDTQIWSSFQKYCFPQKACGQPAENFGHVCLSDEHYLSTMLTAYKLDEQRDAIGHLNFITFDRPSWHPKSFFPDGHPLASLYEMRTFHNPERCAAMPDKSLLSAAKLFNVSSLSGQADDKNSSVPADPGLLARNTTLSRQFDGHSTRKLQWDARSAKLVERSESLHKVLVRNLESGWLPGFEPMQMICPLLGRKVSAEAVSEFASVAFDCEGLGFADKCLFP